MKSESPKTPVEVLQQRQAAYVNAGLLDAWWHRARLNAATRRFERASQASEALARYQSAINSQTVTFKGGKQNG